MKKLLFATVAILGFTAFGFAQSSPARSGDKTVREVEAFVAKLAENVINPNAEALDRLYADDSLIVTTNGTIVTKAQNLQSLKANPPQAGAATRVESITPENARVRVYKDTAVWTGSAVYKGSMNNNPVTRKYAFTIVLVKQNGNWRAASIHQSLVPETATKTD